MSKFSATPESDQVTAIRKQYDREVYELRAEVADLRARLANPSRPSETILLAMVIGVALGMAAMYLLVTL